MLRGLEPLLGAFLRDDEMLLPGRGDSEEPTGEATAVPAMTGNDRRAERASNAEPDGTAQAPTGLTTLVLAHL